MSNFRSPIHMAQSLCEWGMDPSTVRSFVLQYFDTCPSIENIKKHYEDHKSKEAKRKARFENVTEPIGSNEEIMRRMMAQSNKVFVKALWREIDMIQIRKRYGG